MNKRREILQIKDDKREIYKREKKERDISGEK